LADFYTSGNGTKLIISLSTCTTNSLAGAGTRFKIRVGPTDAVFGSYKNSFASSTDFEVGGVVVEVPNIPNSSFTVAVFWQVDTVGAVGQCLVGTNPLDYRCNLLIEEVAA
jgi:hypothetical protein